MSVDEQSLQGEISITPPEHLARRLPQVAGAALRFAFCYAFMMALAIAGSMVLRGQILGFRAMLVAGLVFGSALVGGFAGRIIFDLLATKLCWSRRLALMALLLSLSTIGLTAFVYFLQIKADYEEWHAPVFTEVWMYQMYFTGVSAAYTFMVFGLPLFLPFGVIVMGVAAVLAASNKI